MANRIQENARKFQSLVRNQSHLELYLAKDRHISVNFRPEEFAHLEGIGQIKEEYKKFGFKSSEVLKLAANGFFSEHSLKAEYPVEYAKHRVEGKIKNLGFLETFLVSDFQIYRYENKEDVFEENNRRIQSSVQADYVLLCKNGDEQHLLFLESRNDDPDKWYVKSIATDVEKERVRAIEIRMAELKILQKEFYESKDSIPYVVKKEGFQKEEFRERPLTKRELEQKRRAEETKKILDQKRKQYSSKGSNFPRDTKPSSNRFSPLSQEKKKDLEIRQGNWKKKISISTSVTKEIQIEYNDS